MNLQDALIHTIRSKSAHIVIVGLGYVGLPLAIRYSNVGYRVTGLDVDLKKVDALNNGRSFIQHINSEEISRLRQSGFSATDDFEVVSSADAIIMCVPTPLNKFREPDLSYVVDTIEKLQPFIKPGQVLSLESTTYPGTTDEVLLPRVQETGLKVGQDIFLVYSPEREDPGNSLFTTDTIPKVCGGYTPACKAAGVALYEAVIEKVIPVSSTRVAEMTKLLENIHRAVNIGLVNEMKIVADKMEIDILEVIDAAATKPFGFTPYYPGPGLGGHCIPIDPFYLTWKAREFGLHTRFIELSGEINKSMPDWVVKKLQDALNQAGKPLKLSKILVLGVAYKRDVDDMRESPSVEIMEILRAHGAEVAYHDPFVPAFPNMRDHQFELRSLSLTGGVIEAFDAVLIATDHSSIDYEIVLDKAQLIVDTRGVYRERHHKVVKA